MPVMANIGIQTPGVIAWNGLAARPHDVRKYIRFGFVFEVIAPLAADTIFKVQSAMPSAADPCVPGPFTDVEAMGTCQGPVLAGTAAQVTIPAGTAVGTVCSGTIPCKSGAFIQIVPVSGDTADVTIVLLRQGPKMG